MENPVALLTLKILFLSCIAVGGFIATVPELNRFAVQVQGWMSDGTFATLFALSQASPGPNLIIATLVGWEVAGFAGAVLATAATCLPTLVIAYQAMRLRAHHGRARWFLLVERAILPIAVGLILACQSARNFDPLSAPNNDPAWSARVAGPMRCSLHTAQPDRASGVSVIPAS
ncbi:chromate transporter (plasmid) [Paracoccus ferrooxidans]|nr:chromate transporter [Paracoccus ferrooxidans]